ncbi:hypothetical protein ACFPOD_09370 [Nitratireductor kimnyeongensis]|uniref:Pyridoxamine 5'-phosphate oxidase putative domain-containing protein n=1 Tax=Nitratireductor kimnyeongensis TaxID=430679 RepID=A0ABW0T855_9HYPH|nr:hypothetical protein [Nitratireductor kimnyeongensis]QZZ36203.1 hypothetical protein KW403_03390 [Nitratireductor kimnyeongensis]
MPRAQRPHSPEAELAAHSACTGDLGIDTILSAELSEFCESGVSVIIAVGGRGNVPLSGQGCACRVLEGGRMRILLLRRSNQAILAAADQGAPVAVTFSQPHTHRSIQIKGVDVITGECSPSDRQAAVEQLAGLEQELRDVDYARRFTEAYCAVDVDDLVALDFYPVAAFVQTPGPGAGAELRK